MPKPGDNVSAIEYARIFLLQLVLMVLTSIIIMMFSGRLQAPQWLSDSLIYFIGPRNVRTMLIEAGRAGRWETATYLYASWILYQFLFFCYAGLLALYSPRRSAVNDDFDGKFNIKVLFFILFICSIPTFSMFFYPVYLNSYERYAVNIAKMNDFRFYFEHPLLLSFSNALAFGSLYIAGKA